MMLGMVYTSGNKTVLQRVGVHLIFFRRQQLLL